MPSLGGKKKDNLSRFERFIEDLPQLSNEMQLSIMNKVKTGELSIDDALDLARKDRDQLTKSHNVPEEEQFPSQCNFSVHKHGRYRWKKRVIQMDFNTKMLCTIEKGIIKRQLPFAIIKSCDDGVGSRFSISFKGHHDYELEATSLDDKHKIMQLVNQIIYRNIYSHAEEGSAGTLRKPQASQTLREGVLMLHRGGLASFKWVKYEVQLHSGQLTLSPFNRRRGAEGELVSSMPVSIVIHLSDGDTSVKKPHSTDTFTLVTRKNEYHFRVLPSCQPTERDAWVQAIDKLCSDWKRKSKDERMFAGSESLRHLSIAEDIGEDNNNSDVETAGEDVCQDPNSVGDTRQCSPSTVPDVETQTTLDPTQSHLGPQSSSTETPNNLGDSLGDKVPDTKSIPPPPPLPFTFKIRPRKIHTKAFHWDLVTPAKIEKSFWGKISQQRVEVDTKRLYMQFSVKNLGSFGTLEPSSTQHIMLNQKIAHNFNIFLKSFAVQPTELKDKLFIINEEDGGLSDEHITSLRRYVPTVEDVEMYKSYKGPVSELHIVDQYMMEMCDIPYLGAQLDLLLTLRELPISMRDLQPLSQLRGRERTFTLLHALVEQIMLREPGLANFTNELAEFEAVPGASVKGLTAEVDVLKNELQKVIQYGKTFKKRNVGAHHAHFSKDLKVAVEKYNADLLDLIKSCEEMRTLYSCILVKFGEAVDQDSLELFGFICQFIHDFKRARADVM
ncbi:formin-H isoform X2 [Corythoichthys intestinalis]|uniref:formin-H isoform X2 n=1 Tax=Corythoichthys intestinalis TaxID=161448 RepID=UPI0025A56757|nr:formin-H isoform X2 [Corythoichthys intestinalis]